MGAIIPFPKVRQPAPWPEEGMLCMVTACVHNVGRGCQLQPERWMFCCAQGAFALYQERSGG